MLAKLSYVSYPELQYIQWTEDPATGSLTTPDASKDSTRLV